MFQFDKVFGTSPGRFRLILDKNGKLLQVANEMSATDSSNGNNFREVAFAERAAGAAAFFIPAALGILSAAPEPYWLDSPEFTAAAQTLGMPHPPGHPLYVIAAKIFTLIPLGGIAFRVSLASVIFGASATFLLYKICFCLVTASTRLLPTWVKALIALTAAVTASVVPAWWFQCVRQEVYSLQMFLALGAFFPALLFCLKPEGASPRLLYLSAFISGLGFCNQPVMTAAVLPAYIPLLTALSRRMGAFGVVRLSVTAVGIGLLGLFPYALLPLRAASGAAVSLGGVHSPSDFFFVITAKAYQFSMAEQFAAGFGTPPIDTLIDTIIGIGAPLIGGFVLGMILLLRTARTRIAGLFVSLAALIPVVLRLVTGFDPFPADYQGYLSGAIALSAAGFSIFVAVTAQAILLRSPQHGRWVFLLLAALFVLPVVKGRNTRPTVDLSDFRAGRLFSDFCFDRTAPGTLLLPSDFNLFFVLSSGFYIEGSHPDVFVVNPTLLSYPGYLNYTLTAAPGLVPLARSMLVHGTLMESALAEVALDRPLRVEPSLRMEDSAVRYLLPDGPLYLAAPQPSAESDAAVAAAENDVLLKEFYHLSGTGWQEAETRGMLFGIHYRDAVYSARRSDLEGAKRSLEAALVVNPAATSVAELRKTLIQTGDLGDFHRFLKSMDESLP